jgi:hypothetical protein
MTGPLPAPSATGVRTAGDRYQWLVAWGACVDALFDAATGADNPVVSVGIEVDGVGNLDDVLLRRTRPPHAYKQVKYTVDSGSPMSTAYLTGPSRTGGPSILAKIADAWRTLAPSGEPVELSIVTNRLADPADPLVAGRDSRTRLLLPNARDGGPRSGVGKARRQWAAAAGLTEPGLLELLAVLDFDLGRDSEHLADLVKRTMLLTGLRGDDEALRAGINWIQEQVIGGRRDLDLGSIRQAINARGLHVADARVIVSVATLAPDPLAPRALHALDWVSRFDGADAYAKRRPKPPATWQELQSDIEQIPAHLGIASRVAVTGSMRLATAFEVGAVLRMVTGPDVATVQRGQLWGSDTPYAAPATPVVTRHIIDQGDELAIAVEVATHMTDDVIAFLRDRAVPVRRLVVIGPSGGPRDSAVAGPEDASALAVGIRDAARQAVRGHSRVHLFLACPMALALLLGHRWNRIAATVVYEDLAALGYEAAFTVSA